MDAVIIGAMTELTPIENYYRHLLLESFVQRYGWSESLEVSGSDGSFTEQSIMILGRVDADKLHDLITIGRLFNQEYLLLVENDQASKVDCQTGTIRCIGVFWDIDDKSCPGSVVEAVQAGQYTQNFMTGQTWGIQTPEMASAWAARLHQQTREADVPSFFGDKLERDAHLARTYPYGNHGC